MNNGGSRTIPFRCAASWSGLGPERRRTFSDWLPRNPASDLECRSIIASARIWQSLAFKRPRLCITFQVPSIKFLPVTRCLSIASCPTFPRRVTYRQPSKAHRLSRPHFQSRWPCRDFRDPLLPGNVLRAMGERWKQRMVAQEISRSGSQ